MVSFWLRRHLLNNTSHPMSPQWILKHVSTESEMRKTWGAAYLCPGLHTRTRRPKRSSSYAVCAEFERVKSSKPSQATSWLWDLWDLSSQAKCVSQLSPDVPGSPKPWAVSHLPPPKVFAEVDALHDLRRHPYTPHPRYAMLLVCI